jgi:hypothetical protein
MVVPSDFVGGDEGFDEAGVGVFGLHVGGDVTGGACSRESGWL